MVVGSNDPFLLGPQLFRGKLAVKLLGEGVELTLFPLDVASVDGSQVLRSPVEGKVVYPVYVPRVYHHPNGGWEWDL